MKYAHAGADQQDLFSTASSACLSHKLAGMAWPGADRFPLNHPGRRVRSTVWADLIDSDNPLIVTGYSSIGELVDFVADWLRRGSHGQVRIVLGSEPFAASRHAFLAPEAQFTEEVRSYWLEQGVSLRLSGKIVQVLDAIDSGRLDVRVVAGDWMMHAKIYVGDQGATVGSSNFTGNGMGQQVEANARFNAASESKRFRELKGIAENVWSAGEDWTDAFGLLLRDLLQFVHWTEALARACADLLEGTWAERYLPNDAARQRLWPTQTTGIAQALWVIENVGSVLVADATGSGKTRMGAHLVRAVRDRLFGTGRARNGLAVLVAPPAVGDTWRNEALDGGLSLHVVSQGVISRNQAGIETQQVQKAQILALDESHNFTNPFSNRTQIVANNAADHVVLLTATPISKGARDLLSLVQLLGADNFDDATIDTLRELERRPNADISAQALTRLRGEIARFTVRRTKSMLNAMVDQDPEHYRDPISGRVNRYPANVPHIYDTAESEADRRLARGIRAEAARLRGVVNLGRTIARPVGLSGAVGDRKVLDHRMSAATGLAQFNVTEALRSSRAALLEHLAGTEFALRACGLSGHLGKSESGDIRRKVAELADQGPPEIVLDAPLPGWLSSPDQWHDACAAEAAVYAAIVDLAAQLSDSRERGKAELVADAHATHPRLIAFDRHPITLAAIRPLVAELVDSPVYLASGTDAKGKKLVGKALARGSQANAIALCSDAMSEGVNLQGASCMVHLDLPTTLRVAEQRVGRVDRMDSPYEQIESFWPRDGEDFRTRAAEQLAKRAQTSADLIGTNMDLPDLVAGADAGALVDIEETVAEYANPEAEPWDGILDALAPVRDLVTGEQAIIAPAIYRAYASVSTRVVSRVSSVQSASPWAFFAVGGTQHGAPHWLLLEAKPDRCHLTIDDVAARLRDLLADNPPSVAFDDTCDEHLTSFLARASTLEGQLVPMRLRGAVHHMQDVTGSWRLDALGRGDADQARRWEQLHGLTAPRPGAPRPDPYLLGQRWFDLVGPHLAQARQARRSQLVRLRDITADLRTRPLPVTDVEAAMSEIAQVPDIATRISACILGVPARG